MEIQFGINSLFSINPADIAYSSWEEWWTYDGISGPGEF